MVPTLSAQGMATPGTSAASAPRVREMKQAVKDDPGSVDKREALVSMLIGAGEWEDALAQCEAGSDALGHTSEWLSRAVPLYTMIHRYLPVGDSKNKTAGCLVVTLIAAAHATVGADDGKTAELLRTLNAMHSDAQTAGGAAAINVLGTDVGEEVRAQLFHLVGLHVLFYAPARRYSNHGTLAALACFTESAATPTLARATPLGRVGDRMLRQLEALSRARHAEAHALVARAERLHPGCLESALASRSALRETLAAQLGLDRSHVAFADAGVMAESIPPTLPMESEDIVDMVEAVVRENVGHLHLLVRLVSTASLPAGVLYAAMADLQQGVYDGAPPLPRHDAEVHVKGQPCLDDAVAFVWALAWKTYPSPPLPPPGTSVGRASFPTSFQCTAVQLSFWNTMLAAMGPAEGPLDFGGQGSMSDADVAVRCGELRHPDVSLPIALLSHLGRCFEEAADEAEVQSDHDALLARAEGVYSVGYAAAYETSGRSVPPTDSTYTNTAPQSIRRTASAPTTTASPRSYPSPFRQHPLSRGASPSAATTYSPLAQRTAYRKARSAMVATGLTTLLDIPARGAGSDEPVSDVEKEQITTAYAGVLRALLEEGPMSLGRFERSIEVLTRLGTDSAFSKATHDNARRECGLLRLRFVREASVTVERLAEHRRGPAVKEHLATLSDAEKDLDACLGGPHGAECAEAIAEVDELKAALRHALGAAVHPSPLLRARTSTLTSTSTAIPMWHPSSPSPSIVDQSGMDAPTGTPISTPLRERIAHRGSPMRSAPPASTTTTNPPRGGLTPYEQRRLRNEALLDTTDIPSSSSTVPASGGGGGDAAPAPSAPSAASPFRMRQPREAAAAAAGDTSGPSSSPSSSLRRGGSGRAPQTPAFAATVAFLRDELKIDEDYTDILHTMGVGSVDDLALVPTSAQLQESGFKLIHALKIARHFNPNATNQAYGGTPTHAAPSPGPGTPGLWGHHVPPAHSPAAPTPSHWETNHMQPPFGGMGPGGGEALHMSTPGGRPSINAPTPSHWNSQAHGAQPFAGTPSGDARPDTSGGRSSINAPTPSHWNAQGNVAQPPFGSVAASPTPSVSTPGGGDARPGTSGGRSSLNAPTPSHWNTPGGVGSQPSFSTTASPAGSPSLFGNRSDGGRSSLGAPTPSHWGGSGVGGGGGGGVSSTANSPTPSSPGLFGSTPAGVPAAAASPTPTASSSWSTRAKEPLRRSSLAGPPQGVSKSTSSQSPLPPPPGPPPAQPPSTLSTLSGSGSGNGSLVTAESLSSVGLPADLLKGPGPSDDQAPTAVLQEHANKARAEVVRPTLGAAPPVQDSESASASALLGSSSSTSTLAPAATASIPASSTSTSTSTDASAVRPGYTALAPLVQKKILTEGQGDDKPPQGKKVQIHYVGKLVSDGSIFDASRKRGKPFEFELGGNKVIRGFSEAVATMRLGETSSVIIGADKAYGSKGRPPIIPPNSDLEFEMELITWEGRPKVSLFGGSGGALGGGLGLGLGGAKSGTSLFAAKPPAAGASGTPSVFGAKPATTSTTAAAADPKSRFATSGKLSFAFGKQKDAASTGTAAPTDTSGTADATAKATSPSGGFAGLSKPGAAGGFAALASSGGGFKKAEGGSSIFNKPAQPMFGGLSKTSPNKGGDAAAAAGGGGDDDNDEAGGPADGITNDDGIRFEAIVKLTKVETKTGEEGWEELMSFPCKLWRWGETNSGPAWKERGKGEMKVQKNGNTRLLMRRPETKKLCCNQVISQQEAAELKNYKGQDLYLTWSSLDGSGDEATEATRPYLFLMKMKDKETVDKFKKIYAQAQSEYKAGAAPTPSGSGGGKDKAPTAEASSGGQSSGGFKKGLGQDASMWRCGTCFVEVPLSQTKCGACGTVKPGSAPDDGGKGGDNATATAAPKSTFSFGGQATSKSSTAAGGAKPASASSFGQGAAGGAGKTTSFSFGTGTAFGSKTGGAGSASASGSESKDASAGGGSDAAKPKAGGLSFGTKTAAPPAAGGGSLFGSKPAASPAAAAAVATAKPGTAGAGPQKLSFSFGSSFKDQASAGAGGAGGMGATKATPGKLSFAFGKTATTPAASIFGKTATASSSGGGDDDDNEETEDDDNEEDGDEDDEEWEDEDDGNGSNEESDPQSDEDGDDDGAEDGDGDTPVAAAPAPAPAAGGGRKIVMGRRKPKA
eukprot:m.145469 g.145469  ORF g.145469 m.145469 type:complete len:2179 (-) comp11626_c0_seq2:111-6647(-)